MAYTFSVNNTPATGSVAMYLIVSTLVTAGWLIKASSDGTNYDASGGTECTSGATGAGNHGLGNQSAWVRVQAPSTSGGAAPQTRELVFMRGSADTNWRIKYSASAGFTGAPVGGGSVDATHTPSATDEVVMIGTANDVYTAAYASWLTTNGTYRYHVCAGGSAEGYSFYAFGTTAGSSTVGSGMMLDVLATGSYPAQDVDPAVMYVSSAWASQAFLKDYVFCANGGALTTATGPALSRAWMGATSQAGIAITGTNSVMVAIPSMGGNSALYAGGGYGTSMVGAGTNPFTLKDDMLPAWWMRPANSTLPTGVKGCSSLLMAATVLRSNLDTADVAGTKDRIFIGAPIHAAHWLPWSGASPTI